MTSGSNRHQPPHNSQDIELVTVVGAAIVELTTAGDEGRCLVTQRSVSMSQPLLWEFPGGKVEAGESMEEALRREIREELAIEVEVGRCLGCSEFELGTRVPPRRIMLSVFLCRWLSGGIQLAEHRDWRWVRSAEIMALDWSPADRPLLERLRHQLTLSGIH